MKLTKRFVIGGTFAAFVILGGLSWWLVPHIVTWRYWQIAEAHYEKQEWERAGIWYKKVLRRDKENIEVLRRMTKVSRHVAYEKELNWWRRLYEMAPQDVENHLSYAECALKNSELELADKILSNLKVQVDQEVRYYTLEAEVAMRRDNLKKAEESMRQALARAPEERKAQLNLLIVLLKKRDKRDVEEVNQWIRVLSEDSDYKLALQRELVNSAVEFKNMTGAYRISGKLIQNSDANHEDRIKHLKLAIAVDPQFIAKVLKMFDADLAKAPVLIGRVTDVLIEYNYEKEALAWLKKLRKEFGEEFYYHVARTKSLMALKQWEEILVYLEPLSWGKNESYRYAFLARAHKELKNRYRSDLFWKKAVQLAGESYASQFFLSEATSQWKGWEMEHNILLLDILKEGGAYTDYARSRLLKRYRDQGSTLELQRLSRILLELQPKDEANRNNYVMYSLLLGLDLKRAYEMAEELYRLHPKQFIPATTYAFSLYKRNKTTESLKVMESLDERVFQIPEVAFYQTLFLVSENKITPARQHWVRGKEASLLKEERRLMEPYQALLAEEREESPTPVTN